MDGETKDQMQARIDQLERAQRETAKTAWEARRQAALEAFKMPAHLHRIRHDFDEDEWVCEKAEAFARSHVEDAAGNQLSAHGYASAFNTAEEYDADTAGFDVSVTWTQIGPTRYDPPQQGSSSVSYGHGGGGGGGSWLVMGGYTTLGFSTYDEAEEWLRRYLKPVEEVVYFDSDGKPVKP